MKRRLLFIIVFICAGIASAMAQFAPAAKPVQWSMTVTPDGKSGGTITLKATIAPGWHLYGTDIAEGGPMATSFEISGTDMEFTELTPSRKPVDTVDPLFDMPIQWWDADVKFSSRYKVKGRNPHIDVKVVFMTCDGTTCRRPERIEFSENIKP